MEILDYVMGRNSVEPDKPDQTKTATPTTQTQVIRPDAGYELASVTINPVTSAIDSNIASNNIKAGVTILGVEGNVEPDKPDQTKTVSPSTSSQTITPDIGYELASVTVSAVTSAIDSNIVASNIKKNVSILGVTGNLSASTGAFKVENTTEMNALTDMKDNDVCVVKPKTLEDCKTGVLDPTYNYSFDQDEIDRINLIWDLLEGKTIIQAGFTYNSSYPFTQDRILHRTDYPYVYVSTSSSPTRDYEFLDSINNLTFLNNDQNTYNYSLSPNNQYYHYFKVRVNINTNEITNLTGAFKTGSVLRISFYNVSKYGAKSFLSFDLYNGNTKLMSKSFDYSTIPYPTYSLYQYVNNTWTDITNQILAPSQTITPSNTEQTITAPSGYKGLSEVVVEAIPE